MKRIDGIKLLTLGLDFRSFFTEHATQLTFDLAFPFLLM